MNDEISPKGSKTNMKKFLSFIAAFVFALCAVSVFAAFDTSPPPASGQTGAKSAMKNCTTAAAGESGVESESARRSNFYAENIRFREVRTFHDSPNENEMVLPEVPRQKPEIVRKI